MLGRLVTRWEDIVGADLAAKTQPVKIRYYKPKNGGEASASLDIASSPADATVLHYRKDLILERINQIFGNRWITAVRFVPAAANTQRTAPISRPKKILSEAQKGSVSSLLTGISDPDIQSRLERLGHAILQDSPAGL